MTGRAQALAFAAALALVLAAVSSAASAGEANRSSVSLVPLFNANQRFKPKKTYKLRLRARERSGAPVAGDEISFSLRHGPGKASTPLAARKVKDGVFEVPFKPMGPGQYALVASVRGQPEASIPPVRLGVIGYADGIVEVPVKEDAEVMRHRGNSKGKSAR